MNYPEHIKNCIRLLEAAGYSAYAVGGAVRDSLLGKEPFDWDVTTNALPDDILRVFTNFKTVPTGIKHGTVTVLVNADGKISPVEITTFRIDGEYRDCRHPESVEFSSSLRDDLSRRDFTVNAMAFNEAVGIVDVFGGKKDLENKIIRAVGEPEKRFSEDALRILRAFRFASQLGFIIEENTLAGIKKCAPLLKSIARERIGIEFKRLVSYHGATYSIKQMVECAVWQCLFNAPPPSERIISSLNDLDDGGFATKLAYLVSEYQEREATELLTSLRLSNAEKKLVLRLKGIKSFEIPQSQTGYEASARHFLHLYGNVYDKAREMLEIFHPTQLEFSEALKLEQSRKNPISISELAVNGNDILPLCKSDPAMVGRTLNLLLQEVIKDPTLNEKEKLLEIAKKELE